MIEKIAAKDLLKDIDKILNIQDVKFKVTGHSMWPFLKDGKTVIRLSKLKGLKKGQVYLFKIDQKYFLHRLIKIKKDYLIFQGDGNVNKEKVQKEDLIAIMTAFYNKKEITVSSKLYRFKLFVYRLLPRRITLKLFKRIKR